MRESNHPLGLNFRGTLDTIAAPEKAAAAGTAADHGSHKAPYDRDRPSDEALRRIDGG
jgi:hypothetical protein